MCRACHEVIHIGRTALMGREREAQEHFCRVNGATQSEYHAALGEANRVHAERSRHEWLADLKKLHEILGELSPANFRECRENPPHGANS